MTKHRKWRSPMAWLGSRALRRRAVLGPLHRVFHRADSMLVGVGQLPTADIHRILVIRPNHRLGNILLLTPLISELERVFPGAEIDVLVRGGVAQELLDNFFSVRHIHGLNRYMVRHPISTIRTILGLRRTHYDLAIDSSEGSNSGRLLLASVNPRFAVGVPDAASKRDDSWVPIMLRAPRHVAQLPVFVLRHALAPRQPVDELHYDTLDICLAPNERRAGRRVLDALMQQGDAVPRPSIIGIFANATGAKCYDEAWWSRFLAVVSSNHSEYCIVEIVAAHGRSQLGSRFPTFYSSSARKMACVMSNLTCFVSADCGVMHLACASGTPTVGLFSVSDSSKYEPYGRLSQAVITEDKSPEQAALAAIRIIEAVVSAARLAEAVVDPGAGASGLHFAGREIGAVAANSGHHVS